MLDIGSGKGYLLRTWAERWRIEGTNLELNPTFVQEARTKAGAEGVAERVTFVEGPAVEFSPSPTYDVVTCIGAPFAIGSFIEAVAWMKKALKPTGVLAIGDEVLLEPLPPDLMAREGIKVGEYRGFSETAAALADQGLNLTGLVAASPDDGDRYASGSWRQAHAFALEHENHPERAELLRLVDEGRASYLRWRRRYVGWAVFVARLQVS